MAKLEFYKRAKAMLLDAGFEKKGEDVYVYHDGTYYLNDSLDAVFTVTFGESVRVEHKHEKMSCLEKDYATFGMPWWGSWDLYDKLLCLSTLIHNEGCNATFNAKKFIQ